MTIIELPLPPQSVVSANGALVAGVHNRVDATSGTRTMTLPAPSASGRLLVEKTDTSANLVTITGSIRGASTSVSLYWQFETLSLVCDAAGTTWYPQLGHKTKATLDAVYARIPWAVVWDGTGTQPARPITPANWPIAWICPVQPTGGGTVGGGGGSVDGLDVFLQT